MTRPNIPFPDRGDPVEARQRRKLESTGSAWRRSPELERAIAMRDSDPVGYRALGASVHMRVGYYEIDKARAKAVGVDVKGDGS